MAETVTKNPAVSVLLRRIHEAADLSGSASVFCPNAGEAVELDRCRGCEACRGLYIDVTDRSTFLRCAFAPPEGYAHGEFLGQFAKSEGFAVSAPARAGRKEGGTC